MADAGGVDADREKLILQNEVKTYPPPPHPFILFVHLLSPPSHPPTHPPTHPQLLEKQKKSIVIVPSVYVNNVVQRGGLSSVNVLSSICAGYLEGTQPKVSNPPTHPPTHQPFMYLTHPPIKPTHPPTHPPTPTGLQLRGCRP